MDALVSLMNAQGGTSATLLRKRKVSSCSREASRAANASPTLVAYCRVFAEDRRRLALKNDLKESKHGILEKSSSMDNSYRSDVISAAASEHSTLGAHVICTRNNEFFHRVCFCQNTDQDTSKEASGQDSEDSWGVQLAIIALRFYKREISPLLPGSCRYVPTCSDYSIQAYKTYGVLKGTILTAWRLARCNPFGGSGFDPPRWFGEERPPRL